MKYSTPTISYLGPSPQAIPAATEVAAVAKAATSVAAAAKAVASTSLIKSAATGAVTGATKAIMA